MKIALIYADPKKKFSARLTQWFTGSNCYHVAFFSEFGACYDMHRLVRYRPWLGLYASSNVVLIDCPFEITIGDLQLKVLYGVMQFCGAKSLGELLASMYGFRDYIGLALRPLYHLFGKSTRNYGGRICSGWMRDVAYQHDWTALGRSSDPEPSPADWCRALGAPLVLEIKT